VFFVTEENVPLSEGDVSTTSLGLLERIRAQDQGAWQRLVALYGPLVEQWCRRAGLQDADVADVSQEVFWTVARKIGEFRRGPAMGSFRGWLRVIARSKMADWGRRRRGQPAGTGGDEALQRLGEAAAPEADDEPAADAQVLYRRALQLVQRDFEERSWRAFWHVVIDSRPPAEVAQELGLSVNAVYLAKARVLARLREEFAGLLDP
jgi:RNA polymerase sigma-70 factor (ECF subfamily)